MSGSLFGSREKWNLNGTEDGVTECMHALVTKRTPGSLLLTEKTPTRLLPWEASRSAPSDNAILGTTVAHSQTTEPQFYCSPPYYGTLAYDEKNFDRVYSLLSPPAAFPATAHRASSTASIPAHTVSLAAACSLVSFAVAADPNLKEGFRMNEIEYALSHMLIYKVCVCVCVCVCVFY